MNKSPESQLNLFGLLRQVWKEKIKVLKFVLILFLAGLVLAVLTPKQFTASTIFIPQSNEDGGSNLGGLAALAGVSLGSAGSGSEIPPNVYHRILSSTDFKSRLVQTPLELNDTNTQISYAEYYDKYFEPPLLDQLKKYTIGLPYVLVDLITNTESSNSNEGGNQDEVGSIVQLSPQEVIHFQRIDQQLKIQFNKMEGIVTLSFTMNDPIFAAQMAESATVLLQKEIKEFKTQSAAEQLVFIEGRFEEKKNEFENIQTELAKFRDRNQNITSAVARNEQDMLQSKYNFTFSLYMELAKQLEQSKLQKAKNTPIFTVIQPVMIPIGSSAPNHTMILMTYTILGLMIGVSIVLVKELIPYFKQHI